MLQDHRLQAGHDVCSLTGMRACAHRKIHIRRGNGKLLEEHVRHVDVVVLSGMDQSLAEAPSFQGTPYGSELYEVRPGSHHVKNMCCRI